MTVLLFWSLTIGGMVAFGLAESAIRHHLQRRAERRFVARVRRLSR